MTHAVQLNAPELSAYQAARAGAALHDETDHGRLWLSGEDRIAFLQRLTSNDMRLPAGQGAVTLLTSPTARILAAFTVLAQADGLLLLAGPGEGPRTFDALRSQIFFGDKVALAGRGSALAQFGLYGPKAAAVLAALTHVDLADLPLFAGRSLNLAGAPVIVQRNEGLGRSGYTLLAPAAAGEAVKASLLAAGVIPLPERVYQTSRIEAGIPASGAELTEQVNPLEAGLRRFCNEHKGCYTGQEIIARQITYDKVTTHLVGLLPDGPVEPGAAIESEGRKIG